MARRRQWACMRRVAARSSGVPAPQTVTAWWRIAVRVAVSHCSHSRGFCGSRSACSSRPLQSGQRPRWTRRSRSNLDEAIAGADVVCAATSTIKPILRAGEVRLGTHIASVGYIPNGREVDPALLRASLLVVEHRATTLQPFPVGSNDVVELVESGALNTSQL